MLFQTHPVVWAVIAVAFVSALSWSIFSGLKTGKMYGRLNYVIDRRTEPWTYWLMIVCLTTVVLIALAAVGAFLRQLIF
jgi:hypothetical protein